MASEGDIRVLLVMDLLLSTAFAAAVVWGLSLANVGTFTWGRVAGFAVVLAVLTYLVVLR